jgi:RNA polymerase sigma-70 factor (ECF subfamily)
VSAEPQPVAVEQLWRDLHDRVEAFVRRRVPTEADADDVVQDVFLRLHAGLGAARLQHAEAFVYRVARNTIADFHRRRRPEPDAGDEAAAPQPEDDDVRELLSGCMRPFVARLPDPYREALVLAELEGVPQVEAARRLGLSPSGMRSRVQRGREKLRALFDACCRFEIDGRGGVMDCQPRKCDPGC